MFHCSARFSAALLLSGLLSYAIVLKPAPALAQECIPQTIQTEPPAEQTRTISIDEWQATFSIPENYLVLHSGSTVEILSPSSYEIMNCILARQPEHGIRPHSVSVSLINRALTEGDIRAQLDQAGGIFWGPTTTSIGTGYMHSTNCANERIHLSLPMPDYSVTVVFSAPANSTGEIAQEGVFETAVQSFRFES